jgi:hypothetical protein
MQPEEKAKVTPEIFTSILLDEIAQGIKRVEQAIRESIPEGIIESYEFTATTTKQEIRPPVINEILKKWHKVSVLNKGPESVKIGINVGRVNAITIEKNRSYEIDMKSAKIEYIIYYTDSGTADIVIDTIR